MSCTPDLQRLKYLFLRLVLNSLKSFSPGITGVPAEPLAAKALLALFNCSLAQLNERSVPPVYCALGRKHSTCMKHVQVE